MGPSLGLFDNMPSTLGVVPIFVNVGAAIVPAIIAGIVSVGALLFKPRLLFAACRKQPVVPILFIVALIAIWLGGAHLLKARNAGASPPQQQAQTTSGTDWSQVALEIIRTQQNAPANPTPSTPGQVPPLSPTTSIPGAPRQPGNPFRFPVNTPPRTPGQQPATPSSGETPPTAPLKTALVFRTDFTRSGYDGLGAPTGLKQLWQYTDGDALFFSTPAVVGNRVYGATCRLTYGVTEGSIFCLDTITGKLIWTMNTFGKEPLMGFFSSPAITADGKYLVIGQGIHQDAGSSLICLETATGKLHWRIKTTVHLEGSPAILGNLAVAGAGAIEGEDNKPTGDPGFILAVRISDGKELWRYAVNDPECSPALADGVAYVGSVVNGSAVLALRTSTDAELKKKQQDRVIWKTTTPYQPSGEITLASDLVLIGGGNGTYMKSDPNPVGMVWAFNRKDGKIRWQTRLPDTVMGALAVRSGKVICPVRNGEVIALNLKDGKILWQNAISEEAPVLAAPAFTGKLVYAVSADGYLAILNANDGKIQEKYYINDPRSPGVMQFSVSSPTLAGGKLYVASETGGLQCFAGGK